MPFFLKLELCFRRAPFWRSTLLKWAKMEPTGAPFIPTPVSWPTIAFRTACAASTPRREWWSKPPCRSPQTRWSQPATRSRWTARNEEGNTWKRPNSSTVSVSGAAIQLNWEPIWVRWRVRNAAMVSSCPKIPRTTRVSGSVWMRADSVCRPPTSSRSLTAFSSRPIR